MATAEFGQRYDNSPVADAPKGLVEVDKVRAILRLRLYRKDEKSPWSGIGSTTVNKIEIPDGKGATVRRLILLERKSYSDAEVKRLPRLEKNPLFTQ